MLEVSVKHFSCIGRFQGRQSLNVVNGSMLCTLMNTNIYSTTSLFQNKNNILFPCYSSDKKSLISETDSGVSKVGDQE